jgi:hypothetical protein
MEQFVRYFRCYPFLASFRLYPETRPFHDHPTREPGFLTTRLEGRGFTGAEEKPSSSDDNPGARGATPPQLRRGVPS